MNMRRKTEDEGQWTEGRKDRKKEERNVGINE
jgi:hypothetical protein